MDKDVDNKTLKQNLYDLKLRIYYMEQKNKYLEDDDGADIYQKYVDLQVSVALGCWFDFLCETNSEMKYASTYSYVGGNKYLGTGTKYVYGFRRLGVVV